VLLTTQERLRKAFPTGKVEVIDLDLLRDKIAQESKQNLKTDIGPDALAYVMYTSGSEGRPKGVEVRHRGILRLLFGVDYVALDSGQSILQMAPISFDASTFELWGALLHGARCVLFPDRVPTTEALGRALRKHTISTLWLTASLYNMVIDEAPEILSDVRQLLIGGEALSVKHVLRGLDLLKSTKIINGYGPTESTTFTCCYRIPRPLSESTLSIAIGRPIGNTEVYLLDRNLQPVPVGIPGELYIGGDGLARGYLNRPELTAEKFIPDPFGNELGARLYKTGDLGRYLAEGNIEFLGRIDDQVKIRGFRIELGEIESKLAQHPGVRDAVVAVYEETPDDKRLVAYYVPEQQTTSSAGELRSFLMTKLPGYMMPSDFIILDALPLTSNGKVDRRSLPAPGRGGYERAKVFVAPRDEVESRLAKIWETLLNVESVGVQDNFFELGGHSILAARLMAQVEKEFNRPIRLAALFAGPTIEELADHLRHKGEALPWNWLLPLQPVGSKPPVFLLHGSGELWRQLDRDHPVYGGRSHGLDGWRAPSSVGEMARDYVVEIRMVQPEGPYCIGGFSFGGLLAFEVAQQLKRQGQEVSLLILLDPTTPSNSQRKPAVSEPASRAGMTGFGKRLGKHWRSFRPLGSREKVAYVEQGVRWRLSGVNGAVQNRLKSSMKMLICRIFLAVGRQIPERLRMFYFLEVSRRAARNYVAEGYGGRAVLLRTREAGGSFDWSPLVSGGLEVYEMPGRHMDAIQGPHMMAWADRLRACINVNGSSHSVSAD
jgi:aspartate racemase